ncbi:26703_t:CDS:2, partial [Dentiscutata erythropus]
MTTPTTQFNLPSLDSAYNFSAIPQQYLVPSPPSPHSPQQVTVTAATLASYVQAYNSPPQQQQEVYSPQHSIHTADLYATAYPSPRVDDSSNNGVMMADSSPSSSPPAFAGDNKPVINGSDGYPSNSAYNTAPYPSTSTPSSFVSNESSSTNSSPEQWSNGTAPFPFGSYTKQHPKGFDERAIDPAFFTDPSMIKPSGPNTANPIAYYPGTVGYDRTGIPQHPANYHTPQEYPVMAGRYTNGTITVMPTVNGNGTSKSQPQQNPPRPPPVPAPQAMMTTFSSKTVSSTPKRYKCNICQKRFTRPSSLQTHTYSHTGEKPFKCPVEGCGRHFSV